MFLKDTDGDDKADVRERVLSGLDSADTHHTSNSFRLDPGGAVYFQEGTFHHTQVETPYGPPVRLRQRGRLPLRAEVAEVRGLRHLRVRQPARPRLRPLGPGLRRPTAPGNVTITAPRSRATSTSPTSTRGMQPFYQQRTRPCPGTEILSSRHFPERLAGQLPRRQRDRLPGHPPATRSTTRTRASPADEQEPIVSSSDPNFRPSDIEVGPDGAIYFLDWQNPIIGHMQHNLRDPSRDRTHGRVYRVTYEGRPLLKPAKIAGEPIERLLDLLKEPEDRVRYRAKIELGARGHRRGRRRRSTNWVAGLDKNDPDYEHHLLEALWVHQYPRRR